MKNTKARLIDELNNYLKEVTKRIGDLEGFLEEAYEPYDIEELTMFINTYYDRERKIRELIRDLRAY